VFEPSQRDLLTCSPFDDKDSIMNGYCTTQGASSCQTNASDAKSSASRPDASTLPVMRPQADVFETTDAIEIVAAIPGADDRSTEVTIENDLLTLKAAAQSVDVAGHRLVHKEYALGRYERVWRLSDQIDRAHVAATVKDGIVRVRLPKVPQALQHKIPVVAG
jgi:HSP20 family protein